MECLHGKPASSSTTQKGVFSFCGQKPSCEFFCPEEDCYMFGKPVASFHKSKCIHPTCYTHGKLAQMRMVKDKITEGHTLSARTEIIPAHSGNGQMLPRVLNRYVDMTLFVVCPKSRKMVLTIVAYSTVVLKIEKTPVDSLNGNSLRTHRVFIKLGASLAVRGGTSTWSQIRMKHLQVVKMT